MSRIYVIGNCQAGVLADVVRIMRPEATVEAIAGSKSFNLLAEIARPGPDDMFFLQGRKSNYERFLMDNLDGFAAFPNKVRYPKLFFTAFHPDFVFANAGEVRVASAIGGITSAIALFAWQNGFTVDQTVKLFRGETYDALGYFDHWDPSAEHLLASAATLGLSLEDEIRQWRATGCFLHCPNHPKPIVMAGMARQMFKTLGWTPAVAYPEYVAQDHLVKNLVWPLYPEIGERFGLPGHMIFKMPDGKVTKENRGLLPLDTFIEKSFALMEPLRDRAIQCDRLGDPRLRVLLKMRDGGGKPPAGDNPYRGIKDHQRWKTAVANPPADAVDPVVRTGFTLGRDTRVATAGSCFAQHIARALKGSGYSYFIAERSDGLAEAEALARNFGIFSARYGNIYTARQLVQLFDRSEGTFVPAEPAWLRRDGRYVDPFRPQVEPDGFATEADVAAARDRHLAIVRRLWRELEVFVFTLGLTEAWCSTVDGAVFPLAPGVAGGAFDPAVHAFHNFTAAEVEADLLAFVAKLRTVNPAARIILTVSPVPLIATYEDRHALTSTTYSKAVLRVAADAVAAREPGVDYFPSYEIVTGAHARGAYFESDLRSVTDAGVDHVMRTFLRHYGEAPDLSGIRREQAQNQDIVCDEEMIEQSLFAR